MAKTAVKRILAVAVGPTTNVPIGAGFVARGQVRPYIEGLIAEMSTRRHQLGTDYLIDYRQCEPQDLPAVMADAVKQTNPDLIFPMSTSAVLAAMSATDSIPIVFPSISDPVADGVVMSCAVPGRNVTGVRAMRTQTADDCLELFKATIPSLEEVIVLHKPEYGPVTRALPSLKAAATRSGVTLTLRAVSSETEIQAELSKISQRLGKGGPAVGVLMPPDDLVLGTAKKLIKWAHDRGLPTFTCAPDWVTNDPSSGVGGYGIPQRACGEAAAEYVHKILWNGASPGDLPIKRIGGFRWLVNAAVAAKLATNVRDAVRRAADQVFD